MSGKSKKAVRQRQRDAAARLERGESIKQIMEAQRGKWGMSLSKDLLYKLKNGEVAPPERKKRRRRAVPDAPFNDDGSRHLNGGPIDLGVLVHALEGLPPGQYRVTRPDGAAVEIDVIPGR